MAYSVVRTDLMSGTTDVAKLKSFTFETDLENGRVVLLGGLASGRGGEIYTATAPAANSPLTECVLVAGVETSYDPRFDNPDQYINKAGTAIRGYDFEHGNIFSVTTDGLDGTAAVGSVIELQADTKFKVVAEATEGSTVVGEVIALDQVGTKTFVAIKIK